MFKSLVAASAALMAASCTVMIAPEDVFLPDKANLRGGIPTLGIVGEEAFSGSAVLRHAWVNHASGALAVTWAETGADRLIVHCMGNTTDRYSDGITYLRGLVPFGDAVIFDYPGYGDSAGLPTIGDFDAALNAMAAEVRATSYQNIVLWGHSLGGFVCGQLAAKLTDEADTVVFEATASDVRSLSRYWVQRYQKQFLRLSIDERLLAYDSVAALDGFAGEVIVIGAAKDDDLPVALPRKFSARLRERGLSVTYIEFPEAGHYDISQQPDYIDRIAAALE